MKTKQDIYCHSDIQFDIMKMLRKFERKAKIKTILKQINND